MPGQITARLHSAAGLARALARGEMLSRRGRGRFVTAAPSPQSAIDSVPVSWASAVPVAGTKTGTVDLFDDERVRWAIAALGGVQGASCVELGPLEGGHSYMLERAGAGHVTAIEANSDAFLKCLVVKELLGMSRCSFLCGDVSEYLASNQEGFDVCWCAGILYHMVQPVELLSLISGRARSLYIWTHYFDAAKLPPDEDKGRAFRERIAVPSEHEGFRYTLHRHDYGAATRFGRFWGGNQPYSHWLTLDDLLGALDHLGWTGVQTRLEEDNPHGPAVNVTATR
jgi:hypothetical protein